MTTFKPSREEFDQSAKEFFDKLPSATEEEADAGFKCLVLLYVGMEGTERDVYESAMIIKIAARKMIERDFRL